MTLNFRTLMFAVSVWFVVAAGGFALPSLAADFANCSAEPCKLPNANARYFLRYGAEGAYAYLETEGQQTFKCTAPLMGDMAIGKTKRCGYLQMPKSTETWSDCALQGQTCDTKINDNEVRRARLGYGNTWVYFYTSDKQFQCGLPYMGLDQERVCQISNGKFTAAWSKCADEGKPCKIAGDGLKLVRYIEKTGAKRYLMQLVTGNEILCGFSTFRRDPAPYVLKECQVAALVPVGSDAVAAVLKSEQAAEAAESAGFVGCVSSNAYQKPVVYYGPWIAGKRARFSDNRIPDLAGWRTCDLGVDAKAYIFSYAPHDRRYGNNPVSSGALAVYQEIEGQKSVHCDFKLLGRLSDGSLDKTTCWKHKISSSPTVGWTKCADYGKTCETGLSSAELQKGTYLRARYGTGSQWIYRYVSGKFTCSSTGLNVGMEFDPAPGLAKECQIAKATKTTPKWVQCGKERQGCRLPTDARTTPYLVRYGSSDNAQASFSVVTGRDVKCGLDYLSPSETFAVVEEKTTMSANYSVTRGPFIDPAPGKPKSCAYAVLDGGFKPAYQ